MYLQCFVGENPKEWPKFLTWAKIWYNNSFQTSLGMKSFRAVYGHDPPIITKYHNDPPSLQGLSPQHNEILSQLKKNLLKAQNYMKNLLKERLQWTFK